jgi:hypothetical protein
MNIFKRNKKDASVPNIEEQVKKPSNNNEVKYSRTNQKIGTAAGILIPAIAIPVGGYLTGHPINADNALIYAAMELFWPAYCGFLFGGSGSISDARYNLHEDDRRREKILKKP